MKKILVLFILFTSNFLLSQNQIIVGPQNDCALKNIKKNVHTSSEWFDVTGVTKLKINTLQHRTYDKSRIYNENGVLIWEWNGESYSDTWYRKEHFLNINTKKIKVEFTQGYSDPFCNGFVQVEKISFDTNHKDEKTKISSSDVTSSFLNSNSDNLSHATLSCKECKEIVEIFYESYVKAIPINSIDFYPMKALVVNCYKQNYKECGNKMEEQLDLLSGGSGGPLSYGESSVWRIDKNLDFSKLRINKIDVISNFKNSFNENLIKECSECKDIVEKFYNSWVNKTKIIESEFTAIKEKVQMCVNQKFTSCGSKMEKQLNILSGGSGGPLSYGEDSKWRIGSVMKKIKNLEPEFKNLTIISNGDVIFMYNNLYGVKDKNGLVFILPKYDKIENINFNNKDYFIIKLDDKKGVLDTSGNQVLPFNFKEIKGSELNPNILTFKTIDNKNGVLISNFIKKEIQSQFITFSSNGFCVFNRNNKVGFIDNNGDIIIQPKYDDVDFFTENYSLNYLTSNDIQIGGFGGKDIYYIPSNEVVVVRNENKIGLVGGKQVKELVAVKYDKIGHKNVLTSKCKKGLIPVWLDGKMGYVNDMGNILIEPKYDEIIGYGINGYGNEVVSYVKNNGKYGLISNSTGLEITSIKYDEIYNGFNNYGTTICIINNKKGILNTSGSEIISPRYDEILNFGQSKNSIVIENGLKGIISIGGDIIVTPKYQEIGDFINGNASIKYNNKWGIINSNGIEIIAPIYDYPVEFEDGVANVSQGGKSTKIDTNGQKFVNKFQTSKLSDLTIDGKNLASIIEKVLNETYVEISTSSMVNSMLTGSKTNTQKKINESLQSAKNIVEEWLGGPMTKTQVDEFNAINNKALASANFSMSIVNELLKSDKSQSKTTSSSVKSFGKSTCNDCQGSKYETCNECMGNGKYTCKPCYGSGKLGSTTGMFTCTTCNGSGTQNCRKCYGKGKKGLCRTCSGKGYIN